MLEPFVSFLIFVIFVVNTVNVIGRFTLLKPDEADLFRNANFGFILWGLRVQPLLKYALIHPVRVNAADLY